MASDEENADDGGKGKSGDDQKKQAPSLFRSPLFKIGAAVVIVALLVGGLIWWLIARQYEDTDDAFIDTHIVQVAPQIAGQVIAVAVTDNQLVRQGELLVALDPSDMQARLAQALAQQGVAQTQHAQAVAAEAGAEAQAQNAERDLARYRLLEKTAPAAVAQTQLDQATAAARNAIAQRDAARAQIAGALAQINADEAVIATARLQLSYARIVAPADGHVAQKTVAVGNYVSPGQAMLAIVPLQLWITANFKETQLAHMRPGQHVTVKVDACGGRTVDGHIDSIQRGAGQAFGILPAENATGNYVKVVQRVPVKILLDRVPPGCPLGPGMSVEPDVKVR